MAVSDLAITFATVLEWQAPDGDVLLVDGGVVKFDPGSGEAVFTSSDPDFGSVAAYDVFDTGVGDQVEGGTITFAPSGDASVASWWRTDLENTRLRIWVGEVDPADGVTLTNAEPVADWLVDTPNRDQGNGQDLLTISFMTRQDRMFEVRQGNVCSDPFHQSIWPGERGFENSTDAPQFFAWGAEAPPAGSSGGGTYGDGQGGGGGGGGNGFPNINLF